MIGKISRVGNIGVLDDEVLKISKSVFVTNFPESISARDLWKSCSMYGTVVDVFIPSKKSKAGKRFMFVCFIKVFNLDRLVENLCTIWIGKFHLFANKVRFERPHKPNVSTTNNSRAASRTKKPLNSQQTNNRVGSYANIINGISTGMQTPVISSSPALVLDDSCLIDRDMSNHVLGKEMEYSSDVESAHAFINNELNPPPIGEEPDDEFMNDEDEVPETIFGSSSPVPNHRDEDKNAAHSDDPFGLYDLLKNKKGETNHVFNARVMNSSQDIPVDSNKTFSCQNVVKSGGSVLDVMEDIIRVGQVMGYSMEGCVKDLENIIGKQGEDNDYISTIVDRWNGESIIIGDFKEVRSSEERRGACFNPYSAKYFDCFISNAGIVDVTLEGYAFTWSHPSASKMSKLDRFLVSDGMSTLRGRKSVPGISSSERENRNKGVLKVMETIRSRFFNGADQSKKKLHGSLGIREVNKLKGKGFDFWSHCKKRIGNGDDLRFWFDCWIGDVHFRVKFPRLFALDLNKEASVAVKLSAPIDVSFHRNAQDGLEDHLLADLTSLIYSVTLSNSGDRWVCDLVSDGSFRVKEIRNYIDDLFLPHHAAPTRWIKYIPIKVNIFASQARQDCLPTRVNLIRRGITIESSHCPVCSICKEDVCHIFFHCNLAQLVLRRICRWWGLDPHDWSSFQEWQSWILSIRFSSNVKAMLEGVFFVSWWFIWNFKNQIIFEESPLRPVSDFHLGVFAITYFFPASSVFRGYGMATHSGLWLQPWPAFDGTLVGRFHDHGSSCNSSYDVLHFHAHLLECAVCEWKHSCWSLRACIVQFQNLFDLSGPKESDYENQGNTRAPEIPTHVEEDSQSRLPMVLTFGKVCAPVATQGKTRALESYYKE
nr:RNA-directed DNA polymerase, eukaryota [Tanacetum cinerariifolium]